MKLISDGIVTELSMVQFERQLELETVPEWAQQYVDYKALKRVIADAALDFSGALAQQLMLAFTADKPSGLAAASVSTSSELTTATSRRGQMPHAPALAGERVFFARLDTELVKVERFYTEKASQLDNSLSDVEQHVHYLMAQEQHFTDTVVAVKSKTERSPWYDVTILPGARKRLKDQRMRERLASAMTIRKIEVRHKRVAHSPAAPTLVTHEP